MGVRWLCLLGVWSLGRRCVRVCVAVCLHLPCAGGSLGDRAQGGGLPLVLSWPSADQPGSEHARRPRLPAACAHDSPLRFLTVCSFGCDGCVCATETRILKWKAVPGTRLKEILLKRKVNIFEMFHFLYKRKRCGDILSCSNKWFISEDCFLLWTLICVCSASLPLTIIGLNRAWGSAALQEPGRPSLGLAGWEDSA